MARKPEKLSVRWMYKQEKKWVPFCGADSIALETEYANAKPGSRRGSTTNMPVVVRGGMLEVDVQHRVCTSIFWEGHPDMAVIRGTWFTEEKGVYQPLAEEDARNIEKVHGSQELREKLATLGKKRKTDEILHKLEATIQKGSPQFVAWYGEDDVWLNKDDIGHRVTQAVGGLFGGKKKGQLVRAVRLRRGWHTVANVHDSLPRVSHLVLVVHGIGQALSPDSVANQSLELSNRSLKEMYKDSTDGKVEGRVEFLPVEWRTSLKLDKGVLERITPQGISHIRKISNLAVMDVLYYTSRTYGAEIMEAVSSAMNRQFQKFIDRHPWFATKGRVSILAHSLGSVISYDIMASMTSSDKEKASNFKLNFHVENFFAIGSPLSLFWTLGGKVKPSTVILPESVCSRMYNIYQPSDPVAYRWEPFIIPKYSTVDPVQVSIRQKPKSKSSVSESGNETDGGPLADLPVAASSSFLDKIGNKISGVLFGSSKTSDDATPQEEVELESEDSLPNAMRLTRRYDYALKESFIESTGQYFRAITAHLCYWTCRATLQFILSHID